jgi:uncharacterized protein YciI
MKYAMFYQFADGIMERAPAHLPSHLARLEEFRARGTCLMAGVFANTQEDGAMAIFTTEDAAKEFIDGDPLVVNDLVRHWYVWAWNEGLAPS